MVHDTHLESLKTLIRVLNKNDTHNINGKLDKLRNAYKCGAHKYAQTSANVRNQVKNVHFRYLSNLQTRKIGHGKNEAHHFSIRTRKMIVLCTKQTNLTISQTFLIALTFKLTYSDLSCVCVTQIQVILLVIAWNKAVVLFSNFLAGTNLEFRI